MRRWRGLLARRGQFFSVPPPQPPLPPPQLSRSTSRPRPAQPRRGRFFPVPPGVPHIKPPMRQAGRRFLPRAARGRFFPVPPAAAAAAALSPLLAQRQILAAPAHPRPAGAVLGPSVAPVVVPAIPPPTPFPGVPLGVEVDLYLGPQAGTGGTTSTPSPTLVGGTVPLSAIQNAGSYYDGLTKQQADARFVAAAGRGLANGYLAVTKLFWNGPGNSNQWTLLEGGGGYYNSVNYYAGVGTRIVVCIKPAFTGATNITNDQTVNLPAFLAGLTALGYSAANCDIVMWQEPANLSNAISVAQYASCFTPVGSGGLGYAQQITAAGFPLVVNVNYAGAASNPVDNAVSYALAAVQTGATISAIRMDYYTNHASILLDALGTSGYSISGLADAYGLKFGLNEWGSVPKSSANPAGLPLATCLDFAGYLQEFFTARALAGKPPDVMIWYDGVGSPYGVGDITAPLLSPADRASFGLSGDDPRISNGPLPYAGYQQVYDALTAPIVTAGPSSGGWEDITAYVYSEQPTQIAITRSRPDAATQATPCTAGLKVTNVGGPFSPHNPSGPFYGQFGRNTPLRASIPAASSALRMEDDAVSYCSAPAVAVPGFADIRVDVQLSGWQACVLASQWGATAGNFGWAFLLNADGTLSFWWTTDGSTINTAQSTAPLPWPGGRITLKVTYAPSNGHVLFYAGTAIGGPWTQIGGLIDSPASGDLFTGTAPLAVGANPYFAALPGYLGTLAAEPGDAWSPAAYQGCQGLVYELQVRSPVGTLLADPQFYATGAGTTSFTDVQGNTWTTSGTAEISDRLYRVHAEVSEWPPEWAPAGTDAWTKITASGLLRRLSQKNPPLPSAYTRAWQRQAGTAYAPVAYWPCEDGGTSGTTVQGLTGTTPTQIASGITGGLPMGVSATPGTTPTSFAANTDFICSNALPTIGQGSWIGIVPSYAQPASPANVVRCLLTVPAQGDTAADTATIVSVHTSGDVPQLDLKYSIANSGSLRLLGYDNQGNQLLDSGYLNFTTAYGFGLDGHPALVEIALIPSGSTVRWRLNVLPVGAVSQNGATGTVTGTNALGRATAVLVGPGDVNVASGLGQISVQAVYAEMDSATSPDSLIGPLNGWAGEAAGLRFVRLCAEQSYPCRITGFPAQSVAMGPQSPQTLSQLLAECENADHGLIIEPRGALALGYRTSASMAAQSSALAGLLPLVLDYAQDHLGRQDQSPQWSATDDDQLVINDEEVTRGAGNVTGSSFGAQLTTEAEAAATGALNITPPPPGGTGVGDYQDAQTINVAADSQLGDQAWWIVHTGTVNEPRYTQIPVDLATTDMTALFYEVLGLDGGDYLQVLHPPVQLGADTVKVLIWGLAEQLGIRTCQVQWAARPESPWEVLIAGTGSVSDDRADTDGSTLAAAILSSATSLSVATAPGFPVWTTVAGDFPFDIVVSGERMTVTGITGATSPQAFTVIRSVNGVVKAHNDGEPVNLFQPCYAALI